MIQGNNFKVEFDESTGTIYSLTYDSTTIIAAGNGPKLDVLRAFTNNDNWFYSSWFDRGLHHLQHKAKETTIMNKPDGSIVLAFTVESQAPHAAKILGGTSSGKNTIEELTDTPFGPNDFKFTTNQIWTVYPDGSIELQASVTSNQPDLVLPRLGYAMKIPQEYANFTYYGRGPIDNYADRKSGQFIEQHKNTVAGEFVNFPKPQDMGNHEDVRWCALTNQANQGAVFIATDRLSVSALPYSAQDLILASHPYQLPQAGDTWLHLDAAVTGLGGNSCGQGGPLVADRVFANNHNFGFIIRPAGKDLSKIANIAPAGEIPLSITRSKSGTVEITSARKNATICYTVGKSKVKESIEKFSIMRTLLAIERADVCLMMIDANEGVTDQDAKIAGEAHEAGKGVIIVVNKWDEYEKETGTLEKYKKEVYNKLSYLSYAPIIFISAKTGQRVDKLFTMINNVAEQNAMRVSTSVLNQVINEAIAVVQPPSDKGKRLKILYGTQVSTKQPTFVIFVNNKELFHFSYERYLVNQIRKEFGLVGTPIRIISREKSE